ncbi:hypothetical protein H4R22_001456 [Coemansia sp. RSA 1290]|nr:hypothetical protein H4R22_001456 [Coemansia sp. RSA 1290]
MAALGISEAMPRAIAVLSADSTLRDKSEVDEQWKEQLSNKVIQGLRGRAVSVGRSSDCMVQIGSKATTISRKHADIVHVGGSRCELRVLGMNGVRVNGQLHLKGASIMLNDSDELNFVGIRYKFRIPKAEELSASNEAEADDWWPAPVAKKRLYDAGTHVQRSQHKRARLLVNESESLYGSADTLVNSSEAGLFSASNRQMTQQLLDDLPPSSPPPMHSHYDMLSSESGEEYPDDLPDSVDIETITPAQSQAATPAPTQQPAVASSLLPIRPSASLGGPTHAFAKDKVAKENIAPVPAAGTGKAAKPGKALKPARSAPAKRAAKADDEIMASLRELLGIVDPSECLADAIDRETEEFLTTRPQQPISLPSESKLVDVVVETMVFSARTSHTVSDLLRDIARLDSSEGDTARAWRHHLVWTLFHNKCFGRVERRVKDASDRRAEDRWYYDAAKDECTERRENFGGLVRTARRCTLRDTQYFFKQVPKLPSFRYR